MSIQLITGFTVNNSTPLDNRIVASGSVARNSIPYKYTGLRVFDTSNNRGYYYNGSTFSAEVTDQVNGVAGYVPVFTSQNYIGNSGVFQVNSGTERRIGINTTNPTGVYTYMQFGGTSPVEDPSWFSGQSLPLTIHKGGTNVIASNWYYTGVVGGNGYFNSTKGSSLIGLGNEGDVNISNRPGGPTPPVQTIYFSNNNKVGIGSNWNSSVLPAEVLDVTGNIKTSGFFKGDGSQITNIISDRSKTASSVTVYNGTIGAGNQGGNPVGRLTYLMFSSTASNVNGASVSTYYYNSRGTGFAYDTNNDQLLFPKYVNLGGGDYYSGPLNPPIAFSPTTGIFGDSSFIGFAVGGSRLEIYSTYSYALSPIRYSSGSNTAPSITFNTDTNTGIYRSTSDQISFTTNGTPRMHIKGTTTGDGGVLFTTATTVNSSVKAPYIQAGSVNTSFSTALLPDYTWHVYTQTGIYMPSANVIGFTTNGSERMRINSDGGIQMIDDINTTSGLIDYPNNHTFADSSGAYTNSLNIPSENYDRQILALIADPSNFVEILNGSAMGWEVKFGVTTVLASHSLGDTGGTGAAFMRKWTPKTSFSFILPAGISASIGYATNAVVNTNGTFRVLWRGYRFGK